MGGFVLFLLVHGIRQMQNVHHCEDNAQVNGEAPLVNSKRGQREVMFDHLGLPSRVHDYPVLIVQAFYTEASQNI